jgi:hypothetical protein
MDIYRQHSNLRHQCMANKHQSSCAIVCGGRSSVFAREIDDADIIAVNTGGFVEPQRLRFWFLETVDQFFTSGETLKASTLRIIDMANQNFSGQFLFNPAQPGAGQLSNIAWAGINRLGVPRVLYNHDRHGSVAKMRALSECFKNYEVPHPIVHCAGSLSLAASFAVFLGYQEISVYGADFNNEYFFHHDESPEAIFLRDREKLLLTSHDSINREKHEAAHREGKHPVNSLDLVSGWGQVPISQFMNLLIESTSANILWRWCSTGDLGK